MTLLAVGVGFVLGLSTTSRTEPFKSEVLNSAVLDAEREARKAAEAKLASNQRVLDALLEEMRVLRDSGQAAPVAPVAGEQTETLAGFEFSAKGFQEALLLRRDELGKSVPLAEFLGRLSPEEAAEAMDSLRLGPQDPYRRQLAESFMRAWAQKDPAQVLAYSTQVGRWDLKQQAIQNGVRHLAKTDPNGAIAWLDDRQAELSDHLYRRNLLLALSGYGDTDPQGALDYAAQLAPDRIWGQSLRRLAFSHVFAEMAVDGRMAEARAYLETLPEGDVRAEAQRAFLSNLAGVDPDKAFDLAPDSSSQRYVVREWARRNPKAAAAFVEKVPVDHPEHGRMVADVVQQYTNFEYDAPADWLNQFPPSPQIDRAAAIYANRTMERDAAGAMTWAASITNPEVRSQAVLSVAREWKNQNVQALESFLYEDQTLSMEQKHQLLPSVFPAPEVGR